MAWSQPATAKQIQLFVEKATQYHGWDVRFMNLVHTKDLSLLSRKNISNYINTLFESFRDFDKKTHLANRLRNLPERGGERYGN